MEEEKTEETKIILWLVITFTNSTNTVTWGKKKKTKNNVAFANVTYSRLGTPKSPYRYASSVMNTNSPAGNQYFDTAVRLENRTEASIRAQGKLGLTKVPFAETVL